MQIAPHPPEARAHAVEARFREVFRGFHGGHSTCVDDEWLDLPCRGKGGDPTDPVVWSRRNGPWRRVPLLLVGAAPGNAGGMGRGDMGAHGTRIPFGGDVAGANLDVLLDAVGFSRADVFLAAALNRLPDAGGGEPTIAELARPAGRFRDSVAALRATILASGAALVVALGNVALRTIAGALAVPRPNGAALRLPSLARLRAAGFERNRLWCWPSPSSGAPAVDPAFSKAWRDAWHAPLPGIVWLLHPSAQNMSPHAGAETAFHARMVETRAALRAAVADPGIRARIQTVRADPAAGGDGGSALRTVYDTREWRERVGPKHHALLSLWREKGVGPAASFPREGET